jgi:hypothetical protein
LAVEVVRPVGVVCPRAAVFRPNSTLIGDADVISTLEKFTIPPWAAWKPFVAQDAVHEIAHV